MAREGRIFRMTAFSTLVLSAVALYGLTQQGLADRRRSAAAARERALGVADDLRELIREAGREASSRLKAFDSALAVPPERLASPPLGALAWEPKNAVVWQRGVPEELAAQLAGRKYWLEWNAPGRKTSPRRELTTVTTPSGGIYHIIWGRVDNSLYALVFDRLPIDSDFSWWLWAMPMLGVAVAAAATLIAALALRRAAAQARLNDELKTRFISEVTHELKTPLAAMGLWTDLFRSGRLQSEERRQHALSVVAGECKAMLRMIDQLLEFSRLEEHRRAYAMVRLDVGETVCRAVEMLRVDFPEGGLTVTAPEGMMAFADRDAVQGILVNLLGNAVKYAASEGAVEVLVTRAEKAMKGGGKTAWIQVWVSDHGPGIPKAWRARLFERFRRGNDSQTLAKGGFGLGLPISRSLARGMGGELSVHSRADGAAGAAFLLELPALATRL